jgi:beta-galactosidase
MGDPAASASALTITNRYFVRGGRPFLPVMGEYHYARDSRERWREELLKMKAGGITIVSTYLLWILHEEMQGEFDWSGNRDVRAFVLLAAEAGLDVVIRVGPWAHGETRNGGLPDWLQELPIAHRTNDPAYLEHVERWFGEIAGQVDGLFHGPHNPHAPIIGIQLENELYEAPEHLVELRAISERHGMHAALWTATGWGGAQLPPRVVLPLYAGYPDGFWESSDVAWPEFGVMHFTFNTVRDDLSVGADLRGKAGDKREEDHDVPFATCELGGGMQVAYHRRPLVDSADVAALALTKLGSGSGWQGYYLYHGSVQKIGRTTTQESHETGYPNDLPVRDYDFFAPLGSYGQVREHYHLLRMQHLLLAAYGDVMAQATTTLPTAADGADELRWAVRSNVESGFLFVNNRQPASDPLPDRADIRFEVDLGDARIVIPSEPVLVASGVSFIWPLRQRFGGVPPLSATVQPITEIMTADGPLVFFAAIDGIAVEFQLDAAELHIEGATVERAGGIQVLRPKAPAGPDCVIRIGETRLVILDPFTASRLYRFTDGDRDIAVVWDGAAYLDGDLILSTAPETKQLLIAGGARGASETVFSEQSVPGSPAVEVPLELVREQAAVVAPRLGGPLDRLSAPTDEDFEGAAVYAITLPVEVLRDDSPSDRLLLHVDWVGDVARLRVGDELVSDQFWYGRAWEIDLTDHLDRLDSGLTIEALAWNADAGVYVDARVRPVRSGLEISSVTVRRVGTIAIALSRK